MMDPNRYKDDVVQELLETRHLIPKGIHEATITGYEFGATVYSGRPFCKVALEVGGQKVWSYLYCFGGNLGILNMAMPLLVGKMCKVKIQHREFETRVFNDATILGDIGTAT
jgi:hypothetical protein